MKEFIFCNNRLQRILKQKTNLTGCLAVYKLYDLLLYAFVYHTDTAHYKNKPIQINWKFYYLNMKIFR